MPTISSISSAGGRPSTRPPPSPKRPLSESTLLDYIRFQVNQNPAPAAESVNRRVGTAERAMRCEFPEAAHLFAPGFQNWYWRQSRLGYGRLRPALTQLRVKTPKRLVVPLSVEEVARFWSSFRTARDLAIVGLMLLHGLRSCEVLALNREDVQFPESQIRVLGKGKRHCCPARSRIESIGCWRRVNRRWSRRPEGPVKWAFSRIASRSRSVEF